MMESLAIVFSPKMALSCSAKPKDMVSARYPFALSPQFHKTRRSGFNRPATSISAFHPPQSNHSPAPLRLSKSNVLEKSGREGFASITSSNSQETSSVGVNPPPVVPPPPSYFGSPLFWVGVGVGLSALFSWVSQKLKNYAMQQATNYATKTMMEQMAVQMAQNNQFTNAAVPPGSPRQTSRPATSPSPATSQSAVMVDVTATEVEAPSATDVKDNTEVKQPKRPEISNRAEPVLKNSWLSCHPHPVPSTTDVRKREKKRNSKRERQFMVQCTTSSSSSTEEVELDVNMTQDLDGKNGDRKGQFGDLVRDYGWKVRRMVEEQSEMRKVAQVQAEAFYVPVFLFNDLFFQFFQAEVLSGLLYKLRNSAPNRYACLVAESNTNDLESRQGLVGVVDVTALRDEAVLQHLSGAKEYLYVSGIAVLNTFRRRKVATALLKACDMVSILWGFEYLVLRAYEDDLGALKLYGNAGYRIVSADPPWMSTWIGRKRRVLMIKRPSSCSK